ncbi:putative Fe-S oxidoreductase [Treponema primitia ZAS-2]|uniref:Putative Fe-S oxidoreductase n=1 Tax=Treponema primitia (strain ATCC BAA-887 / DSM 12427 / ZAS-2) TaxID=545694 RepID=F5YKK9_TREPZ|nr:radical SAM protein [Treponema primitia]AEF86509.1 putative Fe-S oxidoreductase [Treponema primitia ZAS-2]
MEAERTKSSFNSFNSKRKLESVFLFTTGKCNAKCAMCFYANDMAEKKQDLNFEEIKKLSETAGDFNRLWLSGGEPTLREDLPEIIEMFYKNNHIKDINFPTNGTQPDRVIEWLKRIRKNCPDVNIAISISLDGFQETHDRQRGLTSFYKAVETVKKIDDNFGNDGKIIRNLATVITKYNVQEVEDLLLWVYGRFNASTHTIEAARGVTREDGVKVLTEKSLRKIQDDIAPYYIAYADRVAEGVKGKFAKWVTRYFYVGLMRTMYNIRASNLEKPTPWNMDCTAGETTLVLDYDGRFRGCELRPPIGTVQEYGCDVQKIMHSDAMKNEIAALGHGHKANCWCTHGCWIMSSITFSPGKMISKLMSANKEVKKLYHPLAINEAIMSDLEKKYNLDMDKLAQLGIVEAQRGIA